MTHGRLKIALFLFRFFFLFSLTILVFVLQNYEGKFTGLSRNSSDLLFLSCTEKSSGSVISYANKIGDTDMYPEPFELSASLVALWGETFRILQLASDVWTPQCFYILVSYGTLTFFTCYDSRSLSVLTFHRDYNGMYSFSDVFLLAYSVKKWDSCNF